jgi:hypothetical protein
LRQLKRHDPALFQELIGIRQFGVDVVERELGPEGDVELGAQGLEQLGLGEMAFCAPGFRRGGRLSPP